MFCYQIKFVVDTDNDNDVASTFSQFLKIFMYNTRITQLFTREEK